MTINPHRITVALDRAKPFGPTTDAKLGAVEPDLDNWEAGRSEPNEQQLERLAVLANVPVSFFTLSDDAYPRLAIAHLCGGRRPASTTIVVMLGEPEDVPQPALFDQPEPA